MGFRLLLGILCWGRDEIIFFIGVLVQKIIYIFIKILREHYSIFFQILNFIRVLFG